MKQELAAFLLGLLLTAAVQAQQPPNIVFIYSDDVGYGDISCYGAADIHTPNIDRLAAEGLRFTNGHATAATCTPSRYSLLTGQYAWRKTGTGIAPGNAGLIIPLGTTTIASVLHKAGYTTGAVGKWHLGLGGPDGPDWNGSIKPGPLELGFDYSYIIPATLDRVPTIFIDNHKVAGLDPKDPIVVSYNEAVGDEPTGKEHPELLRYPASHGHDQTIINGIGRIGYMAGGKSARWVDEEVAQVLCKKALSFISGNKDHPFFLYYATTDIHVPRMPNLRFHNQSGLGLRGDAILQLDWCVGEVLHLLDSLHLTDNTLVVFSSDNGPVVDDGYDDGSVEHLGSHRPAGPFRGGKYSKFEGGTRMPFILRWPGHISRGVSDALVSQVDFLASLADLTHQPLWPSEGPDSFDELPALLGKTKKGRDNLIEDADGPSIVRGKWKYIAPNGGAKYLAFINMEMGNDPQPQLYDLSRDSGETDNLAGRYPDEVKELQTQLEKIKQEGRSRPLADTTPRAAAKDPFPPGTHRILFLGNSITYAGGYVSDIETYFVVHFPGKHFEFINAGLPSETVSGLSEPGHAGGKFPRPDLHERLARMLAAVHPEVVFACYGMNDGIYMPFDEDRFAAFRNGIRWLHDELVKAGVKEIVHLTPPVHDDKQLGTKGYNLVLDRYSRWLLAQRDSSGWQVADIHFPMTRFLEAHRATNPHFILAADGVHPGELGHWLMARAVLAWLGEPVAAAPSLQSTIPENVHGKKIYDLVSERQSFMKDAWLKLTRFKRPDMPVGMDMSEARQRYDDLGMQLSDLLR